MQTLRPHAETKETKQQDNLAKTDVLDRPVSAVTPINLLMNIINFSQSFCKGDRDSKKTEQIIIDCLKPLFDLQKLTTNAKANKGFIALAKNVLFEKPSITLEESDALLLFGITDPNKKNLLPDALLQQHLNSFIEQHISDKYKIKFKTLIDKVYRISVFCFASPNLFEERISHDKLRTDIATLFSPEATLATEIKEFTDIFNNLGKKNTERLNAIIQNLNEMIGNLRNLTAQNHGITCLKYENALLAIKKELDVLAKAIVPVDELADINRYLKTIDSKTTPDSKKTISILEKNPTALATIIHYRNQFEAADQVNTQLREVIRAANEEKEKLGSQLSTLQTTHLSLQRDLATQKKQKQNLKFYLAGLSLVVGAALCATGFLAPIGIALLANAMQIVGATIALGSFIAALKNRYDHYRSKPAVTSDTTTPSVPGNSALKQVRSSSSSKHAHSHSHEDEVEYTESPVRRRTSKTAEHTQETAPLLSYDA